MVISSNYLSLPEGNSATGWHHLALAICRLGIPRIRWFRAFVSGQTIQSLFSFGSKKNTVASCTFYSPWVFKLNQQPTTDPEECPLPLASPSVDEHTMKTHKCHLAVSVSALGSLVFRGPVYPVISGTYCTYYQQQAYIQNHTVIAFQQPHTQWTSTSIYEHLLGGSPQLASGYNASYKWTLPLLSLLVTGVIRHLLTGVSHQVWTPTVVDGRNPAPPWMVETQQQ